MFWTGFGTRITKEYKTKKDGFEIEYKIIKNGFFEETKKRYKVKKNKLINITKQLWK